MTRIIPLLLLGLLLVVGCVAPKEDLNLLKAKDLSLFKASLQADVDAKLRDLEVRVTGADVEARVDQKINQRIDQEMETFKGQQNMGMFSGGAIYVLILAAVFVLMIGAVVVAAIYLYFQRKKVSVQGRMLSAVTSGLAQVAGTGSGETVQPILDQVKRFAKKAGVKDDLDRFLVDKGDML